MPPLVLVKLRAPLAALAIDSIDLNKDVLIKVDGLSPIWPEANERAWDGLPIRVSTCWPWLSMFSRW